MFNISAKKTTTGNENIEAINIDENQAEDRYYYNLNEILQQ